MKQSVNGVSKEALSEKIKEYKEEFKNTCDMSGLRDDNLIAAGCDKLKDILKKNRKQEEQQASRKQPAVPPVEENRE